MNNEVLPLQMYYHGAVQMAVISVLAAEGIKSLFSLYEKPIKKKKALLLFVGLFVLGCFEQGSYPRRRELYIVMTAIYLFAAIGGYSFVSRFIRALEKRPPEKRE